MFIQAVNKWSKLCRNFIWTVARHVKYSNTIVTSLQLIRVEEEEEEER